jgi:hypothetical protein
MNEGEIIEQQRKAIGRQEAVAVELRARIRSLSEKLVNRSREILELKAEIYDMIKEERI